MAKIVYCRTPVFVTSVGEVLAQQEFYRQTELAKSVVVGLITAGVEIFDNSGRRSLSCVTGDRLGATRNGLWRKEFFDITVRPIICVTARSNHLFIIFSYLLLSQRYVVASSRFRGNARNIAKSKTFPPL